MDKQFKGKIRAQNEKFCSVEEKKRNHDVTWRIASSHFHRIL